MEEALIMKTIENRQELKENIATLEKYRGGKDPLEQSFYVSLVRYGRCFVCCKEGENIFGSLQVESSATRATGWNCMMRTRRKMAG